MSFRPHPDARLPSLDSSGPGWIAYKTKSLTSPEMREKARQHASAVLHSDLLCMREEPGRVVYAKTQSDYGHPMHTRTPHAHGIL